MGKAENPQWYTIREAAAYLQVGEPTIYRWMRENRITYRKVGDSTRFLQEDLDQIIQVHHSRLDAKKATSQCYLCGHDQLVDGHLQSTGLVYFRPAETKFWKLKTGNVKTTAKMCLNCGVISWFGDMEKLSGLIDSMETAEDEDSASA